MTNPTPHGQVPAIQRYSIGYHSDEWGQRSSTPSGIQDASGSWVRYADHVTALAAGQATAAPAGGVVAYLDIGAGGYLDLGSDLSNEAISRLPKGRHALIIAGTYGIDGYTPTPPAQPAAQQGAAYAELEKKHADFVETVGLMLAAIGYKEDYARQWPKEKASVTFRRWFDEQRASYGQAPAAPKGDIDE